MKTVTPVIPYRDADAAVDWLCRAFGFTVCKIVKGGTGRVQSATLMHEGSPIDIRLEEEFAWNRIYKRPAEIGGVTMTLSIIVPDLLALHERAAAAKAHILPYEKDYYAATDYYGVDKGFGCRDLEGHLWIFGSYRQSSLGAASGVTNIAKRSWMHWFRRS